MEKKLTFKITFKELTRVIKNTSELKERFDLKNLSFRTELATSFTRVLSEDVRKRFMSSPSTTQGGSVYGNVQWRELSDSYLRSRPDRVQGKVLIDSGELMNSFQVGSPNLIARFNNQFSFEYGSSVEYAEKIQKTWPIVVFHPPLVEELLEEWIKFLNKDFTK